MKNESGLRFVLRADHDGARAQPGYSDEPIRPVELPLALADVHRSLPVDGTASLQLIDPDGRLVNPSLPLSVGADYRLSDVAEGAGFAAAAKRRSDRASMKLRRLFTLTDTVGPNMNILICGLNPSLYSAEVGVGFGRPGNRFWPAALEAGLVNEAGEPRNALVDHGIGMTDLVKRPTRKAQELSRSEFEQGLARVERLIGWLQPRVVCFVGLAGWRAAVDRKAVAGPQPESIADTSVYLMPSTSGLNAHSRLADLVTHLRQAAALAAD